MVSDELKPRICAGIVTFNPDIFRFKQCFDYVIAQVDTVVIFDNGSVNINEIEYAVKDTAGVTVIKSHENKGIATALARIMDWASHNGYQWVLSMDQDSLLQPGIIDAYKTAIKKRSDAGMFTCLIKDRNFMDEKYERQESDVAEIDYCITSGALTSTEAYKKTEGYDESFFIDCVDFDLCYTMREAGFKIYRVNHVGLLHEVGRGENRRFLWKKIVVYHEKPWRIYYLARNTWRMVRNIGSFIHGM